VAVCLDAEAVREFRSHALPARDDTQANETWTRNTIYEDARQALHITTQTYYRKIIRVRCGQISATAPCTVAVMVAERCVRHTREFDAGTRGAMT